MVADYIGGGHIPRRPTPPPQDPPQEKTPTEKFVDAVKNANLSAAQDAVKNGADINTELKIHKSRHYGRGRSSSYTETYVNAVHYLMNEQTGAVELGEWLIENNIDINCNVKTSGVPQSCLVRAIANDQQRWIDLFFKAPTLDLTQPAHKDGLAAVENKPTEFRQKIIQAYWKTQGPWEDVDDSTISHVSYEKKGMVQITDSFNFGSGERIRYIRDFDFKQITSESRALTELPAQAQDRLKEAWNVLHEKQGTKAPPYNAKNHRHIKKRPVAAHR